MLALHPREDGIGPPTGDVRWREQEWACICDPQHPTPCPCVRVCIALRFFCVQQATHSRLATTLQRLCSYTSVAEDVRDPVTHKRPIAIACA